ncbi:MAG: 16S rRNA (guanine(527)-N(7))-methyltransferase RsmG [Cyanobacteria bacterium J06627_8]
MRSPIDAYLDLSQTSDLPRLPQSDRYRAIWDETIGWQPDDSQSAQLERLYHAILQGNRAFNLTRITEPEAFWEKHIWDSLSGLRAFLNAESGAEPDGKLDSNAVSEEASDLNHAADPDEMTGPGDIAKPEAGNEPQETDESGDGLSRQSLRVIDIGTGGGFPGLPVAIACPCWQLTLLDSTRKKTTFLDAAIAALSIPNAHTLTDRVEAVGRYPAHREQYDIALLRAVAPVSVCAEYALPLLTIGGWAILYRGHWAPENTDALNEALTFLGGEIELIDSFTTPISHSDRNCIILRKVSPTPSDFPRATGIPAKDPL